MDPDLWLQPEIDNDAVVTWWVIVLIVCLALAMGSIGLFVFAVLA